MIKLEFLPTQPSPLFAAQAFSKIGAESTNALPETSPIFSLTENGKKWHLIYFYKDILFLKKLLSIKKKMILRQIL